MVILIRDCMALMKRCLISMQPVCFYMVWKFSCDVAEGVFHLSGKKVEDIYVVLRGGEMVLCVTYWYR